MPERQARGVQATPCKTRTVRTLQGCTGKLKLPQYRAQSVIDAAECVVQLDSVEQFMDELLPYPVSRKRARKIPKRPPVKASNHPFRTLEKADSMREDRVVRLFVSRFALSSVSTSHVTTRLRRSKTMASLLA